MQRKDDTTASRSTEGKSSVSTLTKAANTKIERKRGRPLGSKNQPKALVPRELASEFLGVVKGILPPEYYQEMKDAIRSGKNISTVNEAKILMKLMGPPIWLRLIEESKPVAEAPPFDPDLANEIGQEPQPTVRPFDKDLNERLKVMLQFMQFVEKVESNDDNADTSTKPILEITARRGIDGGRFKFLIGGESGSMGGSADGTGRPAIEVGTLPDTFSERPFDVSDSEQVQTVRVFNDTGSGNDARGEYEEEL